jgi:hypothetical protein
MKQSRSVEEEEENIGHDHFFHCEAHLTEMETLLWESE